MGDEVRMIPVTTPAGKFKVWTRRVGEHPTIKLLLLHGGPGATHEMFTVFDETLAGSEIEFYYYDQLGSAHSDQPDDPRLWEIPRFVDEVEQVRVALGLDQENFFLLGSSWGGILAIEYALAHQQHLKGLIVSNMMSSIPAYNEYAEQVLMPEMEPAALAEIKRLEASGQTGDPRYMELLMTHHYEHHVLRRPAAEWPEDVNRAFENINEKLYVTMQGPSELGASGKLAEWDRSDDLERIAVPTLVIGARHDTMDPAHMERMANRVQRGSFLFCPDGSHLAMWDDPDTYSRGLLRFLREVDQSGS